MHTHTFINIMIFLQSVFTYKYIITKVCRGINEECLKLAEWNLPSSLVYFMGRGEIQKGWNMWSYKILKWKRIYEKLMKVRLGYAACNLNFLWLYWLQIYYRTVLIPQKANAIIWQSNMWQYWTVVSRVYSVVNSSFSTVLWMNENTTILHNIYYVYLKIQNKIYLCQG